MCVCVFGGRGLVGNFSAKMKLTIIAIALYNMSELA